MDAFTAGILQRIHNAEQDLHRALETGDEFLAEVEQSELEDLRRIAADHGVDPLTAAPRSAA
jgi:phosphopentomutase